MFNRLIFAFTLIVSFGMAQIGAVTHEISHYSDIGEQVQQQISAKDLASKSKKSEPITHNQVCEKCLGYAELGHIAHSTVAAIAAVNATNQYFSASSSTPSYAKPRTYRARAPPSLV